MSTEILINAGEDAGETVRGILLCGTDMLQNVERRG